MRRRIQHSRNWILCQNYHYVRERYKGDLRLSDLAVGCSGACCHGCFKICKINYKTCCRTLSSMRTETGDEPGPYVD